jgi:hypothetical protein
VSASYRYRIVRIDGRNRRWIAYRDKLDAARRVARKHVLPGFPVAIEKNISGTELERFEAESDADLGKRLAGLNVKRQKRDGY